MVVRQRPIESITTEGASPSSTTRFTAVVLRCSSVLWSSNRPSIFIGLNISNTYASVDYPSDAAVRPGVFYDVVLTAETPVAVGAYEWSFATTSAYNPDRKSV